MSKRSVLSRRNLDDDDSTDDHSNENEDSGKKKKKTGRKKSENKIERENSSGFNYYAIAFLLLFVLPTVITMSAEVYDYFYPVAAKQRIIRQRLVNCYTAAAPEKLANIDSIVDKATGKEQALFSQLAAKYRKYPECSLR